MFERLISIAVIVIIGAFSRKWHKIDSSSLTKITLDIFMPPLIFISIIDAEIDSPINYSRMFVIPAKAEVE